MALRELTFLVSEEQMLALDQAAKARHSDRASVMEEALRQYLILDSHHRELIAAGIRDDDAGRHVEHGAVERLVATWADQRRV